MPGRNLFPARDEQLPIASDRPGPPDHLEPLLKGSLGPFAMLPPPVYTKSIMR